MDQAQEAVEETAESVNPFVSGPSGSDRSDHLSTVALVKISQDMRRAPIDSVRKHGVEEFHGTSLEESDKAEFWLEKLRIALDKVNVHLNRWPNVQSCYKV